MTNNEGFILSVKTQLLNIICDQWTEEAFKLIRKHDKKLENGDFSLPRLDNEKVWAKFKLKSKCLEKIQNSSPVIKHLSESGSIVIVYLDRKTVFNQYFGNPTSGLLSDFEKISKVQNFDLKKPNSSEITSYRAACISEVLINLPRTSNNTIVVSSTDLSTQIKEVTDGEGCDVVGVRVGAVIGENEKKETNLSQADYRSRVLLDLTVLDEERRDESESEVETESRLAALVEANVQFSFLATNISNPVKLQTSNPSSNFVLYNLARMKQILRTFDQNVVTGLYPQLPEMKNIDFNLLAEPEEWELMFNFLLSYQDVVTDCSKSLSVHKLVTFLCSLASTFSRYYNRVKILKDPLPHLTPAVHAKIYFVKEISSVVILALGLLNISFVAKM